MILSSKTCYAIPIPARLPCFYFEIWQCSLAALPLTAAGPTQQQQQQQQQRQQRNIMKSTSLFIPARQKNERCHVGWKISMSEHFHGRLGCPIVGPTKIMFEFVRDWIFSSTVAFPAFTRPAVGLVERDDEGEDRQCR